MKWPWSKKKQAEPVMTNHLTNCMACRTLLESSPMVHEVFHDNAIGISECSAAFMSVDSGVGEHRLALIAVTGDDRIEKVKAFLDRLSDDEDEIVTTACLYGDHFLCNDHSPDGGRVCECACHKEKS